MSSSLDLRTIITLTIGTGILAAMLVLTGVVLCLYSKVSKAIKSCGASKEADVVASDCIHLCKATQSKAIPAKAIPAESCRVLQPCDECSIYANIDAMPPCFCGIREGL
uniref:Family with sequence similarity 24 member B n=1 Tax=Jaculus jaculus TaxID=51337 RepID=A0A8C5L1H6_JACJA